MADLSKDTDIVVVKIGSSTLVDEAGAVDRAFIADLCEQVIGLRSIGKRVVIVSSGAAAAGMERLGFDRRPSDMPSLQACAACGQAALTEVYATVLARHGIACGQVLLTRRDVIDREGYLNARNTLERLLDLGVVPVVNENDTVSVAEFAFGDNDMLGAIVATLIGADLYVIMSDIDGLYTDNPATNPQATRIDRVERVDAEVMEMAGGAGSAVGTGGMVTKLRAARALLAAGIPTVICRGRQPGVLGDVVAGRSVGTRFEPPLGWSHESPRKFWIGLAEVPQGTLTLDEGACAAVIKRGASVLPVGVIGTEGTYSAGDVVNVVTPQGTLIGRGTVRYSSDEMVRVRGLKLDVIARFMPEKEGQPAIHRDELLVF
ncbi:MAG: glutamate 5-kinase [Atopobiaceae bacterium]|nr:glutamate 5-kinase [Atopobiaceae bacterium]